ncbi:inositol monophosphatase family protein [Polycladidibacter hongkongensis]|uniref:inositol monophosphatase family protein n=1 Tax=Polycladidibacter hongkongensis TaxID=1647556 RepID=UPI0008297307|nr:inositol monophosphatase [Pseudovibrio hongkongensis]
MTDARFEFACATVKQAGAYALEYFHNFDCLNVEAKGQQDMVSEADRNTETLIRDAIAKAFPQDGIVGEEHGRVTGTTGYTWIIDPIDGTQNFITGIPQWCVIIACVKEDEIVIGTIFDPCNNELFSAQKGKGAHLNGKPISASKSTSLASGSLGTGFSSKGIIDESLAAMKKLLNAGGIYFRNASGGLMLSYAAAGRLIGYIEDRMNCWDAYAGLLIATEAGNILDSFDIEKGMQRPPRIVLGAPGVYEEIKKLADATLSLPEA